MLVVYIKRLKLGVRFYFFSLKIILKENKWKGFYIWYKFIVKVWWMKCLNNKFFKKVFSYCVLINSGD